MTLYRSLFFWLRINFIYCTIIVYNKKKSKVGDDGREQAKQKKSKVSDDGSRGKAPVKYNTILLLIHCNRNQVNMKG